jgi:histidyl-tRNA synthetase
MSDRLQSPKGTRDFYPEDMLRRRYIEKAWRDSAIRHAFEEIDGPTFEDRALYERKSGEGILSEMFGVFSGKDEAELKTLRESGQAPYALRPEFTPTLARMYAAKAGGLPKPTRWFWQQNCFRAEKPQRGRLREFLQWNCDIIGSGGGDNEPEAQARVDAELICCALALFVGLGLEPSAATALIGHRKAHERLAEAKGLAGDRTSKWIALLDRREKVSRQQFLSEAEGLGLSTDAVQQIEQELGLSILGAWDHARSQPDKLAGALKPHHGDINRVVSAQIMNLVGSELVCIQDTINDAGYVDWYKLELGIARGLAYYTGMVFEVHETGGKERAIAGGGRYDNLIELFGGPPTAAVGFGMGDVVLSLVLEDRGLMPAGKDLLHALSLPSASLRPDVFVISNGQPECDAALRPLVAQLRRGVESPRWLDRAERKPWDADRYAPVDDADHRTAPPLHARHTSKSTKNIGKLLQEASGSHARFAAIIEIANQDASQGEVTLKNLDTREERKVPIAELAHAIANWR